MGLIINREVDEDCLLGIWKIEESYDELLSQLNLSADDIDTVNNFRNYQRKLEWLSVRVLLYQLLNEPCKIIYNESRKPFLANYSYNISISHSRELTSVLLSKKHRVGIDLEFMSHQIHKVEHKFINEKEWITNDMEQRRFHLYIHWCAKEALYKICDKQDINFKQNLTVLPFPVNQEGRIIGYVDNSFRHEEFLLNYFTYDSYVIVWCKK
jgi:4'-phosphopantetheinyl transferase EntD